MATPSSPARRSRRAPVPTDPAAGDRPRLDPEGRYRAWARISYMIVGTYVFLFLMVLFLFGRLAGAPWWGPWLIEILLVGSLARYLSTHYRIDELHLVGAKLLGGVRVRLDQVRRIEYTSLRDLAPSAGLFGAWGWRGRMWSPVIGRFDAIYTDSAIGLLVTAGGVPVYISPRDPAAFARELSRRVRSYTGRLPVDVGDPLGSPDAPDG